MDFIAKLNDLHVTKTVARPLCSLHNVLVSLDDEEREALLAALDNRQIRHTDLARVLSERGFNVSAVTVSRHRKRGESNGCRCPK
jgi:L-ribulose-5-phosphate 3-epimerase UlaE